MMGLGFMIDQVGIDGWWMQRDGHDLSDMGEGHVGYDFSFFLETINWNLLLCGELPSYEEIWNFEYKIYYCDPQLVKYI